MIVVSNDVVLTETQNDDVTENDLVVTETQDDNVIRNYLEHEVQQGVDINGINIESDEEETQNIITNNFDNMRPQNDGIMEIELVPQGYDNVQDVGYYKIHTDLLNWGEAQNKCQEEGAHLVVVDSEDERNVVKNLFGRHKELLPKTYFVWIGYSDIETEGTYMSVLGEPISNADYIRWTTVNAHGNTRENCLGATIFGDVNDLRCDAKRVFICELPQNEVQLDDDILENDSESEEEEENDTSEYDIVPDGYENVQNVGYYKMHTDFLNWGEAQNKCQEEGAHLVVMDSEDERNAVKNVFHKHKELLPNTDFAWVGYSDIDTEGTYMSVLGEPMLDADFIRWTLDDSHGSTRDNCVGATVHATINDILCETKQVFICELPHN